MEQWFFPGPQRDIDAEGRVRPSPYPTLYSHRCSQLPATEIRHFLNGGEKKNLPPIIQGRTHERNTFEY